MYTSGNRPGGYSANGTFEVTTMRPTDHSPTRLGRWNTLDRQLPDRAAVKDVHIYDFDNTLFKSPLPNPKLWHSTTIGQFMNQDFFKNGGWWHDSRILAATGEGVEVEQARSWDGWWNEQVVSLVQLSMQQKDAITVLLTGRSVPGFAPLIKRMVASKKLEFDIIALKPERGPDGESIKSTLYFKCMFLNDLLNTYSFASEIKVYEDRGKHVKSFEMFFKDYVRVNCHNGNPRGPLVADVIHIVEESTKLDPVAEVREALKMVEDHNHQLVSKPGLVIRKNVSYTGYLLPPLTTSRLLNTLNIPTLLRQHKDIKLNGSGILISHRPADSRVLTNTGPLGTKIDFTVTGWNHYDNKVWAALVEPVDPTYKVYSVLDNSRPVIILAIRRDGKPADAQKIMNWQPVPNGNFVISTIIAEKCYLRIEEDAGFHHEDKIAHHQSRRGNYQSRHNSRARGGVNRGRGGRGLGMNVGPRRPDNRPDNKSSNGGYHAYERHQHNTRPVEPQDMQYLSEMYE